MRQTPKLSDLSLCELRETLRATLRLFGRETETTTKLRRLIAVKELAQLSPRKGARRR